MARLLQFQSDTKNGLGKESIVVTRVTERWKTVPFTVTRQVSPVYNTKSWKGLRLTHGEDIKKFIISNIAITIDMDLFECFDQAISLLWKLYAQDFTELPKVD